MAAYIILSSGLLDGASLASAQAQKNLRGVRRLAQNTNFCGPTWTEVSNDCRGRTRCASDDECTTPGHFCYGDIECDEEEVDDAPEEPQEDATAQGEAGTQGVAVAVPYDDISNTRFCRSEWNFQVDPEYCNLHLFCGDDSPCPPGTACHYSGNCHLHDLMEAELLRKDQEEAARQKREAEGSSVRAEMLAALDPDDPVRFNSCGRTWTDADEKCGAWCWSEGSECPDGEGCFGDTSCYNAAGL